MKSSLVILQESLHVGIKIIAKGSYASLRAFAVIHLIQVVINVGIDRSAVLVNGLAIQYLDFRGLWSVLHCRRRIWRIAHRRD